MTGTYRGVLKTAARRIGVDPDEYMRRIEAGEKWCCGCKTWHPASAFPWDESRGSGLASSCREHRNRRQRESWLLRQGTKIEGEDDV
jgi:hypothetical protein